MMQAVVGGTGKSLLQGKTVLVLGGATYSKRNLWPDARSFGVKIALVDSDPNHPARNQVHHFLNINTNDHTLDHTHADVIVKRVRSEVGYVDGCLTFWEDCVPLTSLVGEGLGLQHIHPYSVARVAKSKRLTHEVLSAVEDLQAASGNHVTQRPRYSSRQASINGLEDLQEAVTKVPLPAVLKFDYGAGSVGIRHVTTYNEAAEHVTKIPKTLVMDDGLGHGSSMVLMTTLHGSEHHVEVVMFEGHAVHAFVVDMGPVHPPLCQQTLAALPSTLSDESRRELITASIACCTALGFTTGIVSVGMMMTSRGPKLLEVNARMGGMYTRDFIRAIHNVDLLHLALMAACGMPPVVSDNQASGYSDNHESGYSDNQASGYSDNQASGYSDNQASGYGDNQASGYSDNQASGYSDNQANGYSDNKGSGYGDNQGNGYSDNKGSGYSDNKGSGYGDNQASGYTDNQASGYSDNQASGYSDNQESGYSDNQASGYSDNQASGYSDNQASGYSDNKGSGYGDNKGSGYSDNKGSGYGDNQASGYSDNQASGYSDNKGSGYGDNKGSGYSDNQASGYSDNKGSGYGDNKGSGYGDNKGSGYSDNKGSGYGDNKGSGYSDNQGSGYSDNITRHNKGQLIGLLLYPGRHGNALRTTATPERLWELHHEGSVIFIQAEEEVGGPHEYEEPFATLAVHGANLQEARTKFKAVCLTLGLESEESLELLLQRCH